MRGTGLVHLSPPLPQMCPVFYLPPDHLDGILPFLKWSWVESGGEPRLSPNLGRRPLGPEKEPSVDNTERSTKC